MSSIQPIIGVLLFTFFLSCESATSNKDQKKSTTDISQTSTAVTAANDTIQSIWNYDYEAEIPVRNKNVLPESFTPQKLIDLINKNRGKDKVILDLEKVSKDTIYVAIKESTYLTQSMGTTGADDYISTTVFTLTELKGIKYVHFNFVEGDHARPGTYNRHYFLDRNKREDIQN